MEYYKIGEIYTEWSGSTDQLKVRRYVKQAWTEDLAAGRVIPLTATTNRPPRRSAGVPPPRLIDEIRDTSARTEEEPGFVLEEEASRLGLLSVGVEDVPWGVIFMNTGTGINTEVSAKDLGLTPRPTAIPGADLPDDPEYVPFDVAEGMSIPRWKAATEKEMKPHDRDTVEVVDEPTNGETILGSRGMYSLKLNGLEKFRWIIQGFQQIRGKDYKDCSSPVLAWTTLLLVLAIAVHLGMDIRSVDAVQAFVQADIDMDVYLRPLKGYHNLLPGKCFRLKKALYGLHQSSLLWYLTVSNWILSQGFKALRSDPCLFVKWVGGELVLVCLYVDDLLCLCVSLHVVLDFIDKFCIRFKATSDRDNKPDEYLGAELTYLEDGGIRITHRRTAKKMFVNLHLDPKKLRSVGAPAECGTLKSYVGPGQHSNLSEEEKDEYDLRINLIKKGEYKAGVGSLIYLSTHSRPELGNAVRDVARYTASPRRSHWGALMHILRYVAHSMDRGIEFHPWNIVEMVIKFYVDAAYASQEGSLSVTGYVGWFGGPFTWGSVIQKHVVSSSGECEVDAVHDGSLELLWVVGVMKELRFNPKVIIYQDNTGAEAFVREGKVGKKTKHMSIRYHRSVDLVAIYGWLVERCETDKMIADIETKNLSATKIGVLLPHLMGWADRVNLFTK
jgi:hypothetical protein